MYHSITIGDVNTWDHWHIVPETRPVINPPEVKTEYVEIPGANGTLDYTEALTGAPVFKDRTGSWTFVVMNGYQEWNVLYATIMTYLHGKRHKIVLEDDPEYVYDGRLSVNEWLSEPNYSKIVIDYVIKPFRESLGGSITDWRWNDLTFGSDLYTIYYGSFNVDGTKYRNIYNPTKKQLEMGMTTTAPMDVWCYGKTYEFTTGKFDHTGIILYPGDNYMSFKGSGRVTIEYDRGAYI